MKELEMGMLFLPDEVITLTAPRKNLVNHATLLEPIIANLGLSGYRMNHSYHGPEQLYYLIEVLLQNNIPFLQEVNDMKPKQYILFIPDTLDSASLKQIEDLYYYCDKWKRFQARKNRFYIVSFDTKEQFMNRIYQEYSLPTLISNILKAKREKDPVYQRVMSFSRDY